MAQKAGFLTKEGGSIKTWKKRWCVLKNGALHYSKNKVPRFDPRQRNSERERERDR